MQNWMDESSPVSYLKANNTANITGIKIEKMNSDFAVRVLLRYATVLGLLL